MSELYRYYYYIVNHIHRTVAGRQNTILKASLQYLWMPGTAAAVCILLLLFLYLYILF